MGRRAVRMELCQEQREQLVQATVAILTERLEYPPSPEALARELGTNVTTLARAFQYRLGSTLARYGRQLRLEQAKRLLRETDGPVEDIALACGYGDRSALTVAFKRVYGMTPGAWREAGKECVQVI